MWDNTASATSTTDISAMSSKVSLVLTLVALHLSGRALMTWIRTSPTSHARLGRLFVVCESKQICNRILGGFLALVAGLT